MKRKIYIALAIFFLVVTFSPIWSQVEQREVGNLVIQGIPEIPERIVDRLFQYQSVRYANLIGWIPESDNLLITTRFSQTIQIHLVEKPGGTRKQITFFPEPIRSVKICPDKAAPGFLFTMDVGGGEAYQIFYFDLKEGKYSLVTDGTSRNESMLWSNRGDKFVYASTKRNGKDFDLYLSYSDNPKKAKLILEQGGSWEPIDWSSDDRSLLVKKYISINESYYYILDIASGELTQINPTQEKISYKDARWSKDGKGIFITSDEGGEYLVLKYYDIAKRNFTDLTAEIPWDVKEISMSHQRDKLAFITNEDGISKLYLLDTTTMKYRSIPGIPLGQLYNLRFHPDGERIGLVMNTPQTPSDIYVLHLKDRTLVRWTYSEVGGLNTDKFVLPDLIHYQTFDSIDGKPRMIPAFYYKPSKGTPPYPVLINIHGGPELQYLPYFSFSIQYFLNELGIAILCPNVRGSAGYGKSYLLLDNGYKRENSVRDIGKLLDWVEKQPELNPLRVAVIGGSYGGYMVLSSMTNYNDRLACGIERVGISNFVTFLEKTKDYRRDLRRAEYGDERDSGMREFLISISPTTNAHKITKPMFIIQGLNDPRVPVGESEQIVSAIREKGGTVWYLLAKDEGHGIRKKKNLDYYYQALSLFLEKYLLE